MIELKELHEMASGVPLFTVIRHRRDILASEYGYFGFAVYLVKSLEFSRSLFPSINYLKLKILQLDLLEILSTWEKDLRPVETNLIKK